MTEGAVTTATMAALLSTIGEVLNAAVGWIGVIANVVTSTPLFMIGVVIMFVGVGIGLVSRLLHL